MVHNQQEADLLIQPDSTGPMKRTFTSLRDMTPPAPHWDVALSIQDNPLLARDEGWIFRSGRYVGALPVDPIGDPRTRRISHPSGYRCWFAALAISKRYDDDYRHIGDDFRKRPCVDGDWN